MRLFGPSLVFLLLLNCPLERLVVATAVKYSERIMVADIVLESRIARLNHHSPILLEYNSSVRDYIMLFTTERRNDMERMPGLPEHYFPMIESYLDRNRLPCELKYLAVLESDLNPFAVSSS